MACTSTTGAPPPPLESAPKNLHPSAHRRTAHRPTHPPSRTDHSQRRYGGRPLGGLSVFPSMGQASKTVARKKQLEEAIPRCQ